MIRATKEFWRGKRVLLTGHSGFKGSWLTLWLSRLGAEVVGVSLPPNTEPNLFTLATLGDFCQSNFCDIRNFEELALLIEASKPEVVFHLAAQPLVRASYSKPVDTFATNVMGTVNVLQALRNLSCVKVAVMVTTDKVYKNLELNRPFRENDILGGHDPYSSSKAASELVIGSYSDSYLAEQGVAVGIARAGNVIGGGDWSVDRLIPDAVRAWTAGDALEIRHPEAIRPWQHVLEPLAAYLSLAQGLWIKPDLAGSYNFGPESSSAASVRELVELARDHYLKASVNYLETSSGPHEAGFLSLSTEKALAELGVRARWDLPLSVKHTMDWYLAQGRGADARQLCEENISAYECLL